MPGEMSVMNYNQSTNRADDLLCPLCQLGQLESRSCKRICELCGYVESCEDIFMPRVSAESGSVVRRVKPSVSSGTVDVRTIVGDLD